MVGGSPLSWTRVQWVGSCCGSNFDPDLGSGLEPQLLPPSFFPPVAPHFCLPLCHCFFPPPHHLLLPPLALQLQQGYSPAPVQGTEHVVALAQAWCSSSGSCGRNFCPGLGSSSGAWLKLLLLQQVLSAWAGAGVTLCCMPRLKLCWSWSWRVVGGCLKFRVVSDLGKCSNTGSLPVK